MGQNRLHFLLIYITHNISLSTSYGLVVAGGWKSEKVGKLLRVWGECLNNVQFYFGNKINIIFG
jgi:hypothetical protein